MEDISALLEILVGVFLHHSISRERSCVLSQVGSFCFHDSSKSLGPVLFFSKSVWKFWALLKVQGLLWKGTWKSVPVVDRLQILNPLKMLLSRFETTDHLFIQCSVIATLWKTILPCFIFIACIWKKLFISSINGKATILVRR